MIIEKTGRVVKGLGGLFEVRIDEAGEITRLALRAKGVLKRDEAKVLVGDNVRVSIDDSTPDGAVISEIMPRRNSLIRPPLANLDYLFLVFAAAKPSPILETVDKLVAIAEHNDITPVIIITKSDIGSAVAEEYADIYRLAGYPTFITSSEMGEGITALSEYIRAHLRDGKVAAFAGASGVGKSTLMNTLFPSLALATAEISHKIERGRHTTRHVEIFDIDNTSNTGFLADTPGFSLIDFARFDFFSLDELLPAFRDLTPYISMCRYADCAHIGEGEDECAVAKAARDGRIAPTRLESYRSIYRTLKAKNSYN